MKRIISFAALMGLAFKAIADVISTAIGAGIIAGAIAAGIAVAAAGLPALGGAIAINGVALGIAEIAAGQQNTIASLVPVSMKKMTAEEKAAYDNQEAAAIAPLSKIAGYSLLVGTLEGAGATAAQACASLVNNHGAEFLVQNSISNTVAGYSFDLATGRCDVVLPGTHGSILVGYPQPNGSVCPAGTTDPGAIGECQIFTDASKPNYVMTPSGIILPNPANPPDYTSVTANNSTAAGLDLVYSDGSTLKTKVSSTDADAMTVQPPLEISVITGTGTGSNGEPIKTESRTYPDGSKNVSTVSTLNVTNPQGVPEKVTAVSTQSYDSSNNPVGSPVLQASNTSSGAPLTGEFSLAVDSGGTGQTLAQQGGVTTPPVVPGTGTGSCTTGDCSTESTQLANKGLLQRLVDFFTGIGTTPVDPTARTGNEIKGASLDGTGAFTGLNGWRLPAHASQCPTSSFAWNGNTYTFDAHCQLATDHFAAFRGVMTLVFSLSALFVVLKA